MEIHDIRYLHNVLPSLGEEKNYGLLRRSKQKIIAGGVLLIMIASIGLITLSISQQTGSRSTAGGTRTASQEILLPEKTNEEGVVVCLEKSEDNRSTSSCDDIGFITDDGETYTLKNVQYEDVARGVLVPGKKVSLTGIISTVGGVGEKDSNGARRGIFYVTEVLGNTKETKLELPDVSPKATQTITSILTPTPLPYSQPTPGVTYMTVKYVVDNKERLTGTTVFLKALVVSEQQPDEESCAEIDEACSTVHFIVNDETGSSRNTFYDTKLLTNTVSEGQIIFTPGQALFAPVYVIVNDLQKVILLLNILFD